MFADMSFDLRQVSLIIYPSLPTRTFLQEAQTGSKPLKVLILGPYGITPTFLSLCY
jgi:hypothetical protein